MSAIVHIIDGDPASPAGIDRLLQSCGYRTKAYCSADEILRRIPANEDGSCLVIDIMSADRGVPDLFDRLSRAGSSLPVILLAGDSDVRTGVKAIQAGAEDFFTKPVATEDFIGAVERAISRHRLASEREGWLRTAMMRLRRLTRREREVLEHIVQGRMNKQIAFELGTTERTVKAHRQKVMEKLQIRSGIELGSYAERLGLLEANSR
ncbi:MAG TPA: LuxR C-terminal-related transcriptional regulator [Bosea sp. (in: a-proteobacteria)]|jgi:FixJ family two-component response regulator|uniref:response regulator transcription factor n=1 Tax=Bosea sp. (in: a-proteobacteria) TaxID=1871050 RepID=UPI002E160F79|nr:LuxR C-terminal-related transcriptional regulator [Bosea sp. (in: a-proteobacteria)]